MTNVFIYEPRLARRPLPHMPEMTDQLIAINSPAPGASCCEMHITREGGSISAVMIELCTSGTSIVLDLANADPYETAYFCEELVALGLIEHGLRALISTLGDYAHLLPLAELDPKPLERPTSISDLITQYPQVNGFDQETLRVFGDVLAGVMSVTQCEIA